MSLSKQVANQAYPQGQRNCTVNLRGFARARNVLRIEIVWDICDSAPYKCASTILLARPAGHTMVLHTQHLILDQQSAQLRERRVYCTCMLRSTLRRVNFVSFSLPLLRTGYQHTLIDVRACIL